jgi:hypothetical protein
VIGPYVQALAAFLDAHPEALRDPSPDGFFSGLSCEARCRAGGHGAHG